MSDVNGSLVTPVSEKESMEYFTEGLKKAASAARQLARVQNHPIWEDISKLCDEIHNSGIDIAHAKPLSRQKTLHILNVREGKMSSKLDDGRPKSKLIVN